MAKTEFETFKDIGSYEISNLKKDTPSAINFVSYRKTKVTIELIEEPKEVLLQRLNDLLKQADSYTRKQMIKKEIEILSKH